jgi:membrane protease YdiL (CAAX protease family)
VELIFTFLKKPAYIRNSNIDWLIFFKSWFLVILFTIPVGPLIEILKKATSIEETEFNYSPFIVFLLMVCLGPVIEELFFRLILKPIYRNCVIFSVLTVLLSFIFMYKKVIFLSIPFSLLTVVNLTFLLNKKLLRKTQIFFLRNFYVFFYLSSLLFGLLHATNFKPFNFKLILIMPVLVSPLIVAGIILGFIRMKFGIAYSILLHMFINLIGFVAFI